MSARAQHRAKTGLPPALTKVGVAVALTFVAGYVDAIGWLTLDRVFIAQMSGNLVLLAVHIIADESGHVSLQADAILAFFLGLVVTGSVIEIGMRRRLRRIFVSALALEFLLLVVFALAAGKVLPVGSGERAVPGWPTYVLVAVVAFAMGAQNTSLRMAGILSVFTTHMTGTLSGLSEELIVCGFSLLQSRGRGKAPAGFAAGSLRDKHPAAVKSIGQSVALLSAFVTGALAGAAALKGAGIATAMLAPLVVLLGAGVLDWLVPLTSFPSTVERE